MTGVATVPNPKDLLPRSCLLVVLVLGLACSDQAGTSTALPGVYSLRSVNNNPLPERIFEDDAVSVDISAAHITLLDDSTFIDARRFRITTSDGVSEASDTTRGTVSLSGDKLDFTSTAGDVYQMVWQGVALTRYAEGATYRFNK